MRKTIMASQAGSEGQGQLDNSSELAKLTQDLQEALQSVRGASALLDSYASGSAQRASKDSTDVKQSLASILHVLESTDGSALPDLVSPVIFPLFSSVAWLLGVQRRDDAPREPDDIANTAGKCLAIICRNASPRETVVAVQERLEMLGRPPSDRPAAPSLNDAQLHWTGATEVAGLLAATSRAVPRLRTKNPSAFLQPLVEAFLVAIKQQSARASAQHPPPDTTWPLRLLEAVCEFSTASCRWASTLPSEHVTTQFTAVLVLGAVRILSPFLPATQLEGRPIPGLTPLSEHIYRWRYGRGRASERHGPDKQTGSVKNQGDIWVRARRTCVEVGIDLSHAATGKESFEERARVGAFILLVKSETAHSSKSLERPSLPALLPMILNALRQGSDAGAEAGEHAEEDDSGESANHYGLSPAADIADCALVWLLRALDIARMGSDVLQEEVSLPLSHALSTHASLSQLPIYREISLHLWKTLLDVWCTDSHAIEALKDAIGESPFPQLRCAAVGVLKDIWIGREQQRRGGVGDGLLCPSAFSEIRDSLFHIPLPLPKAPLGNESSDAERGAALHHLASYAALQFATLGQTLNLLFVLLKRQSLKGALGLADHMEYIDVKFLSPLEHFVAEWEKYFASDSSSQADEELARSVFLLRLGLERMQDDVSAS